MQKRVKLILGAEKMYAGKHAIRMLVEKNYGVTLPPTQMSVNINVVMMRMTVLCAGSV